MVSLIEVKCDEAPGGYDSYRSIKLAPETAQKFELLKMNINDLGGKMLSAGGIRSLKARVGKGRSKTSMHYLGRAFDLPPYAGAFAPDRDPYVVAQWREVLFRAKEGMGIPMCLEAYELGTSKEFKASGGEIVLGEARGEFASFTNLAKRHGFSAIGQRDAFWSGHYGSMEWWHFEDREGLEDGVKFLDEIERVWGSAEELPHWREVRDVVWWEGAWRD